MRPTRDQMNSGAVLPGAVFVMMTPEMTKNMFNPAMPNSLYFKSIDSV
jgi:hypothetical protein